MPPIPPVETAVTPIAFPYNVHPLVVSIYPNPAHDFIIINAGDEPILKLRLLNVIGEVVTSVTLQDNQQIIELPVKNILPGTYLLEISSNQHNHVEKVCIE